MEQITLNIDDTIVYCYSDGSVEWNLKHHSRNIKAGLYRTFGTLKSSGYKEVKINKRYYRIHRLICLAFNDNPNGYDIVDHINRDKTDNRPENLRWVNSSENSLNSRQHDVSVERYGANYAKKAERYRKINAKNIHVKSPDGKRTQLYITDINFLNYLRTLKETERYLAIQQMRLKNGN